LLGTLERTVPVFILTSSFAPGGCYLALGLCIFFERKKKDEVFLMLKQQDCPHKRGSLHTILLRLARNLTFAILMDEVIKELSYI
jgi:hypothetical protein